MLSRDQRLFSPSIRILLRRGKRIHTDLIDFLYQHTNEEHRFACIVSKKVEKFATGRNRTKRLVHSAIQLFVPNMKTGIHGVFIVRRKIQLSYDEVATLIRSVLEKSGVFE